MTKQQSEPWYRSRSGIRRTVWCLLDRPPASTACCPGLEPAHPVRCPSNVCGHAASQLRLDAELADVRPPSQDRLQQDEADNVIALLGNHRRQHGAETQANEHDLADTDRRTHPLGSLMNALLPRLPRFATVEVQAVTCAGVVEPDSRIPSVGEVVRQLPKRPVSAACVLTETGAEEHADFGRKPVPGTVQPSEAAVKGYGDQNTRPVRWNWRSARSTSVAGMSSRSDMLLISKDSS